MRGVTSQRAEGERRRRVTQNATRDGARRWIPAEANPPVRQRGEPSLDAKSAVRSSIIARGSSIRPVTTASKPRTAAS